MKNELSTILQAINLADLEGLKTVVVDLDDLRLLRAIIKDMDKALSNANREINRLEAKIALKDMSKPMSLNGYKLDVRG